MQPFSALKLVFSIGISEAAGIIGSIFTARSVRTWYQELARPSFSPPSWVFGPVWTLLYALMGTAAYMVYRYGTGRSDVRIALIAFGVQLALNLAWSFLFFGLQNPGVAFFEILAMWIAIAITIVLFYRVSVPAALLMLPYLAWVSFASYLNYSIWKLN